MLRLGGEKSCFDSHTVTLNLHFPVLKQSVSLEKPNKLLLSPMLRWNLSQGLKYQLSGPSFLLIHLSDTSSLANIWRRDALLQCCCADKSAGRRFIGALADFVPCEMERWKKENTCQTCSSTRRQRNRFQMQIKNNHAEA